MPRLKRPQVARLNEVHITIENDAAIIEFLDPGISSTHLTIGPKIVGMSVQEILDLYNETVLAREWSIASNEYVAVEIPEEQPQVRYSEKCDQWVPRGGVLRCLIHDDGGEVVIEIDGRDFSQAEFGRMLTTYAGWGMRICFVPEDEIDQEPRIEAQKPDEKVQLEGLDSED